MNKNLSNINDISKFIRYLNGKDKIFVNNAINNLDLESKVKLLKYCVGVKSYERENAEKSI